MTGLVRWLCLVCLVDVGVKVLVGGCRLVGGWLVVGLAVGVLVGCFCVRWLISI
jgi:hypothetical protein